MHQNRSGFTLIELLVVIAIVAVLAVVVVLVLNPAQLIQQSRDSNRISDMASLNSAISFYLTDAGTNGTVSLGSANTVYISIPDPTATSTAGDQCQGLGLPSIPAAYTYHCAASSTFRMTNATGWIPVNFANMSNGSPLGQLPIDPTNSTSSRLYYTYTTNGSQYEVTSAMESAKYKLGGSNDVISADGGTLATVFEKGSKLGLEPLDYGDNSLVGLWTFDEGTGTVAYDYSGNNAPGTLSGTPSTSIPTWTTGKVSLFSLQFYGSGSASNPQSYVGVGNLQIYSNPAFTITAWFNTVSTSTNGPDLYADGGISGTYGELNMSAGKVGGDYGGGSSGSYTFSSFSSTGTYNNGSWHLIVLVQSSYSARSIYVDGVQVATNNSTVSTQSFNQSDIGALSRAAAGYSWNGLIDDVRVYSRALSAAEIQALYNGGK